MGQIRDIFMHGEIPFNVPSRLPLEGFYLYKTLINIMNNIVK